MEAGYTLNETLRGKERLFQYFSPFQERSGCEKGTSFFFFKGNCFLMPACCRIRSALLSAKVTLLEFSTSVTPWSSRLEEGE